MNGNPSPVDPLRSALDTVLDGIAPRRAAQAVERLIAQYRGDTPTTVPVLRDRADVVAYAAYRMPATFEAVRAALAGLVDTLPADWAPDRHLDLGGGTGAAVWAVQATWPGRRPVTVLDRAEPALALGRELAAAHPALSTTTWRTTRVGAPDFAPDFLSDPAPGASAPAGPDGSTGSTGAAGAAGADGPAGPAGAGGSAARSGIVTLSYVLGELSAADQAVAVATAARAAGVVVVVEPGTPDGYGRIVTARRALVEAGLRIAAPCPHSGACPIAPGADWCHFSARVTRSSLHRQVKGGSLAYEDEKFSYVAAVHPRVAGVAPVAARVLRRPQLRKGQVLLELCTADGSTHRATVTKRHGSTYRAARDTAWGDPWEPPPPPGTPDGAASDTA